MHLALFKSSTVENLNFQYQQIMDARKRPQRWIEMLFRPHSSAGISDVEAYFKSLSNEQAVALECGVFSSIPQVLKTENPRRLSVNLMPASLNSKKFQNHLGHMLEAGDFDPTRICIELVESQNLPELDINAMALLAQYRRMGGLVALDDFGSGNSHWELLQESLVDVIKVANQNVTGKDHSRFINALARFAESMDITTVLEGIESQQDYLLGVTQGFDHFQGWYFDPGNTA